MDTFNKQWKTAGTWIKGRVIPRLFISGAFKSCSWTLGLLVSLIWTSDEEAGRLWTHSGQDPTVPGIPCWEAVGYVRSPRLPAEEIWKLRKWECFSGARSSRRLLWLPGWRWIWGHQHCSLACLSGEGGPPSGPASSSLVAGFYCGVCFLEKINQF